MEAALRIVAKQNLPRVVATPQALITKDNVERYKGEGRRCPRGPRYRTPRSGQVNSTPAAGYGGRLSLQRMVIAHVRAHPLRLNVEQVDQDIPGREGAERNVVAYPLRARFTPCSARTAPANRPCFEAMCGRDRSPTAARSRSTVRRSLCVRPARCASRRHRHDPPGTSAGSGADGRAEHVPRPLADPRARSSSIARRQAARRPQRRCAKLDPAIPPGRADQIAEGGAAPDRRDRPGALGERQASSPWTSRRRA